MNKLEAITVKSKQGSEPFTFEGKRLKTSLSDFWSWASSNLLNNTLRGILAEYIVKEALGIKKSIRTEWDAYDLKTNDGLKIEIKSAAYLQSWEQKQLSSISFDIAPTKGWIAETKEYSAQVKRQADYYIFCLLHHTDKSTVDPMNLDQWTFYVLSTAILNEKKENQKRISLNALKALNPRICRFGEIASALD